jgi:hypothetical protein
MVGDAFDIASAQLVDSPDVRSWPITTAITRIQVTPDNTRLTFSKQNDPGRWPDTPTTPSMGPLQYTVWLFLNIAGVWVGAAFVEMWFGRDGVGDAPSDFNKNWFYDARWAPMNGHGPIVPGEIIGMMVMAGDGRNNAGALTVNERSNIVTFAAPAGDAGDFAFPADVPAPVPAPVPPIPPAPTPAPVPTPAPAPAPSSDEFQKLEELIKQAEDLALMRHNELLDLIASLGHAQLTVKIPFLGDAPVTITLPKA